MSDEYAIDSHKLMYHPNIVSDWLNAKSDWEKQKKIYPIYVEMSPYGGCNHRCVFCGVDYMGYQNVKYDLKIVKKRVSEMAKLGIKSIMFAGEGEPLLHKGLPDIIEHSNKVGIDTAITTNFVMANDVSLDTFLNYSSWIKISINAGKAETYAKVHRTKADDFNKVLNNMSKAVKIRKDNNYSCVLGAQLLLLPDNANEVFKFAQIIKKIGVDYLVIKPYSQHLFSETKKYEQLRYENFLNLEEDLQSLRDNNFNVIFRSKTMQKVSDEGVVYSKCYSTPFFWGYVATNGDVYGCSCYLGQENFCYGNINKKTFKEIWEGSRRKKNLEFIQNKLDITKCRTNCRMDEINRYLWRLKNPNSHDNFI